MLSITKTTMWSNFWRSMAQSLRYGRNFLTGMNLLVNSDSWERYCWIQVAPMLVKNAREVPDYEIDPKELDFTNSVNITKVKNWICLSSMKRKENKTMMKVCLFYLIFGLYVSSFHLSNYPLEMLSGFTPFHWWMKCFVNYIWYWQVIVSCGLVTFNSPYLAQICMESVCLFWNDRIFNSWWSVSFRDWFVLFFFFFQVFFKKIGSIE